jgi:hypothetical protein
MATDFLVAQLWIPMIILTVVLLASYFILRKKGIEKEFTDLNGKRVLFGFVGAVLATIIYTGVSALQLGISKVDLGHITYDELSNLYLGYWLYYFALVGFFMLGGLLVIGIPAIFLLNKFRVASYFGLFLIALLIAFIRGAIVMNSPYNNWCESHSLECSAGNFLDMFIVCAVLGVGFGIGAKLPIWRNCVGSES